MNAVEFEDLVNKLTRESDTWGSVDDHDEEDDYGYTDWSEVAEAFWGKKATKTDGDVTVTLIEDIGGEGQGDYAAMIFRVDYEHGAPSEYFRKEGYYASYDGTSWDSYDGPTKVEPYTVEVTKYKDVR